jgi:(2Fe-2S) ferredoxin
VGPRRRAGKPHRPRDRPRAEGPGRRARREAVAQPARRGGERARPALVIAVSRQAGSFAEAFEIATPADTLDLDLTPLRSDGSCGGQRLDEPLFLVCTNGRHDACCAEYGRPVARALASAHPDSTWECSHIGGDRFAANVVCLPEGVYYGRVAPFDAARIAAAHRAGRLVLDHYRGRSCHPFVVQAADLFVRRELGLVHLDDLAATRVERRPAAVYRTMFATRDGREIVADVAVAPDPEPRRLTCQALRAANPPRYALVGLEVSERAAWS